MNIHYYQQNTKITYNTIASIENLIFLVILIVTKKIKHQINNHLYIFLVDLDFVYGLP